MKQGRVWSDIKRKIRNNIKGSLHWVQGKTRMPFSRMSITHMFEKLYEKCTPDFTHPAKICCVGVVDRHYFDLDLGPMTLVLKLDLDMVVTYLHAKN